jgi:hypothetical protein
MKSKANEECKIAKEHILEILYVYFTGACLHLFKIFKFAGMMIKSIP